jgi:glycerol-3-phosphate dehydrogenase
VAFAFGKTEVPLNSKCSTENYQRAQNLCDYWSQAFHLPLYETQKIALRHGMEAETLLSFGSTMGLTRLEIELWHAIHFTMCLNLVDFYSRRIPLFLAEPNHGLEWLDVLGLLAQNELGWSNQELLSQKEDVRSYMEKELNWQVP